jgi:hypothetical protein
VSIRTFRRPADMCTYSYSPRQLNDLNVLKKSSPSHFQACHQLVPVSMKNKTQHNATQSSTSLQVQGAWSVQGSQHTYRYLYGVRTAGILGDSCGHSSGHRPHSPFPTTTAGIRRALIRALCNVQSRLPVTHTPSQPSLPSVCRDLHACSSAAFRGRSGRA